MKITRRVFAFLIVLSAAVATLPAQTAKKSGAENQYIAYVGTYTTKTTSKGIYAFRYDANSGKLTPIGVAAETQDPSWVANHPSGKYLYAVNEAGKNSMVSAFAVDARTGNLTLLNRLPALGEDPCYISFDRTGKYVFVANYTSGNVVVFPIGADGKLGPTTANLRDEGTLGPNKERQEGPHAHWVQTSSDNRFVFVADLGLDRILVYLFNSAKGTLTPNKVPFRPMAAGSGPRHAVFSPDGHFYVLSEIGSTVETFAYAQQHGIFGYLGVVRMLPAGFTGRNDAAEISIHPNGKFLYASNRGRDSIALFRIDQATGKLTAAGDFSVEGKEPRHFAIDPSGKFLLAENQLSDKIVVFRIDQQTGALTPTGDSPEVPAPVCIAFLAAE
jgi:6-phosphogluconolactonase